jgi:hypothetical protein
VTAPEVAGPREGKQLGQQLERRAAFELIPPTDYGRIVQDYDAQRPGAGPHASGLVVDQAIAFVATAAAIFTEGCWSELPHPLVPSWDIAKAWEVLIKHTTVYRALSEKLGVFVDWLPHPEPLLVDVEKTMVAIDATYYVLHGQVWTDEPAEARAGVVGL